VPGETLTSGSLQRQIKARVLALAEAAKPECTHSAIVNTEVLELYGDGRVSVERWSVNRCGAPTHYRVHLPASRPASSFIVRPESQVDYGL
jgi:hypothetical protein